MDLLDEKQAPCHVPILANWACCGAGLLFEETTRTLATMHGSSYQGDGGRALRELAGVIREVLG
jgi:hypothetical protein